MLSDLVLDAQGPLDRDFPLASKRQCPFTHEVWTYGKFRKSNALKYPASEIRDMWNASFEEATVKRNSTEQVQVTEVSPTAQGKALTPAAGALAASSTVRLVAMSDTHGFHQNLAVPEGDILVHCGDFLWGGKNRPSVAAKLKDFARWFKSWPHPVKLLIDGNHEACCADDLIDRYLGKQMVFSLREACGLKILGLAYSRSDWFRHPPSIPEGIDVLLTHEPPVGILDGSLYDGRRSKANVPRHIGSVPLRDALHNCKQPPQVHIFGHVHEARGTIELNGTTFVNAANANPGPAKYLRHGCMVLDIPVGQHPA